MRSSRALATLLYANDAHAQPYPSDAQTEEMWNLIIGTILTGSFLGTKAVVESMRRAGGGVIVNLGSLASIRPGGGSPAYGASVRNLAIGSTRQGSSRTSIARREAW